jgi:chromosome segregation ATPase
MSAAKRDEVDNVGSEFLAVCTKRLGALRALVERTPAAERPTAQPGAQHRAHMKGALTTLHDQLAALAAHVESFRAAFAAEAVEMRGRDLVPIAPEHDDAAAARLGEQRGWEEVAGCELELDDGLSAEQLQQLELENAELHAELNSMVDEVRSVESKMLEISALSSTFAARLSEQAQSIEHIQQDTVSASEYVRSGNKSLESAERHARDYRLFQLLFFVIAALTLLIADWWYS